MALRFADSFQHYNKFQQKYASTNAPNGSPSAVGRFGAGADFWNVVRYLIQTIDAQPTWIVGVAWNPWSAGYDERLITLEDGGAEQLTLRFNTSDAKLRVQRGGTLLGSATLIPGFAISKWFYVEFKATIHASTGIAVVRVDGNEIINLSGQNTKITANASADSIRLHTRDNQATAMYLSDLYICDGTGSAPQNDFLGDVRVDAAYPDGNGNSSQLVGSDGNSTDNYLLVDEHPANDDTDYVESSTVSDKDTYTYGAVPGSSGTVYGLQTCTYAKKTDAGTRKIANVARLSGTEVDSADLTLSTTYSYLRDVKETKPGGGAWTISDINSAEFGVKVTA